MARHQPPLTLYYPKPSDAEQIAAYSGDFLSIHLDKAIDVEVAKMLATSKAEFLVFRDLETLTPDVATALSTWKGSNLFVSAVREIDEATAAALALWPGKMLALSSANPSGAVLRRLVDWKGAELTLGLTSLTMEQASLLASWRGSNLSLNKLQEATPELMEALTTGLLDTLDLGLRSLSVDVAKALARPHGLLSLALNHIETLDVAALKALLRWGDDTCSLSLDGLRTLTPELAAAFSKWKGESISLIGVEETSEEAVGLLSGYRGDFVLSNKVRKKYKIKPKKRKK